MLNVWAGSPHEHGVLTPLVLKKASKKGWVPPLELEGLSLRTPTGGARTVRSPLPSTVPAFLTFSRAGLREGIFGAVCVEESQRPGQSSRIEVWSQDAPHRALLLLGTSLLHQMR